MIQGAAGDKGQFARFSLHGRSLRHNKRGLTVNRRKLRLHPQDWHSSYRHNREQLQLISANTVPVSAELVLLQSLASTDPNISKSDRL